MALPHLLADFTFPEFDWNKACTEAAAHHDERPTWAYVWPAGLRLAHDLSETDIRGRRICDLGCGRGLLGLTALKLGAAHVSFCDASSEVLHYVSLCIERNGLSQRSVCLQHRWGQPLPDGPYDLILGGDILYRPELFEALINSIASGLAPHGSALLSDPRHQLEAEVSVLAMAHRLTASIQRHETYTLIIFRCKNS